MVEIRVVGVDELPDWVELRARHDPRPATLEAYLDWARQAAETAWFMGSLDGEDAATGIAVLGWHEPPGVARAGIDVVPERRGRGLGSALLSSAGAGARARVCRAPGACRRGRSGQSGLGRASRFSRSRAQLAARARPRWHRDPDVDPPDGVQIVSWAKRPDLSRGIYDVAREAYPDVPGAGEEMAAFEDWLSVDMQGPGDRPEATFLALAGDEVVGYAKFSLGDARPASRPTT